MSRLGDQRKQMAEKDELIRLFQKQREERQNDAARKEVHASLKSTINGSRSTWESIDVLLTSELIQEAYARVSGSKKTTKILGQRSAKFSISKSQLKKREKDGMLTLEIFRLVEEGCTNRRTEVIHQLIQIPVLSIADRNKVEEKENCHFVHIDNLDGLMTEQ